MEKAKLKMLRFGC